MKREQIIERLNKLHGMAGDLHNIVNNLAAIEANGAVAKLGSGYTNENITAAKVSATNLASKIISSIESLQKDLAE